MSRRPGNGLSASRPAHLTPRNQEEQLPLVALTLALVAGSFAFTTIALTTLLALLPLALPCFSLIAPLLLRQ
jgi:hypothetical protein